MSNWKKIDKERIEKAVREILIALQDDPDREGLIETPKRVARMYEEVFKGMTYTNDEIAQMFYKSFDVSSTDLVVEKDIPIFSFCEHHLALMYNMRVGVAYIPKGKVLGLSKIARIADMVSKRLQLQERIGMDIAEIMQKVTGSESVMVVIEGEHSCMTSRGIKARGAITRTSCVRGLFESDSQLRSEASVLLR